MTCRAESVVLRRKREWIGFRNVHLERSHDRCRWCRANRVVTHDVPPYCGARGLPGWSGEAHRNSSVGKLCRSRFRGCIANYVMRGAGAPRVRRMDAASRIDQVSSVRLVEIHCRSCPNAAPRWLYFDFSSAVSSANVFWI
jgi:hypothetical protein